MLLGLVLVVRGLAALHARLVGLIGRIAIIVGWLRTWSATIRAISIADTEGVKEECLLVSCVSLRVAIVILAIRVTLHTLLEAALLGRAYLILGTILTLGWIWLLVGLLTVLRLLVSLRWILVVVALVVLAAVVVVGSRHFDEIG